jgi:hypothetical protein
MTQRIRISELIFDKYFIWFYFGIFKIQRIALGNDRVLLKNEIKLLNGLGLGI